MTKQNTVVAISVVDVTAARCALMYHADYIIYKTMAPDWVITAQTTTTVSTNCKLTALIYTDVLVAVSYVVPVSFYYIIRDVF